MKRVRPPLPRRFRIGRRYPSAGFGLDSGSEARWTEKQIVLNHNKSLLTLQCLCVLAVHTDMTDVEVIVVDNGSRPEDFVRLTQFSHGATVVRIDVNRGFGEGNNIGVEYLLTAADILSDEYRCHLVAPDRYSRLRLLTVGRELELDLDRIRIETLSEVSGIGPIDLFFCMANEVLPPMRGLGRINLYHCQFPFPMHPSRSFSSTRRPLVLRRRSNPGCAALGAVAFHHGVRLHDLVLVRAGSVPKTSSGKVRRDACRALYAQGGLRAISIT